MVSLLQKSDLERHYDLAVAKRLDGLWALDARVRIGFSGVVLLLVWWQYGVWEAGAFLLAIVIAQAVHGALLDSLPPRVDLSRARMVQASLVLVGTVWTLGLLVLWVQEAGPVRLVALCGLYLSMMNAMMLRRDDDLLAAADTLSIAGAVLALPAASYWWVGDMAEALTLLTANVAAFGYYMYGKSVVVRLRNEVQDRQMQELHRSRMETVWRLSGGVAHDFNNLLTVIRGNLDLVQEMSDPATKDELARQAQHATQRAAQVTQQLLTYIGHGVMSPQEVDLWQLFGAVSRRVERHLPSRIALNWALDAQMPPVFADREQLETVLTNICLNARDAIEGEGEIVLSARVKRERVPGTSMGGRDMVWILVEDDGMGIAPDLLDKVCEPYFTTRAHGSGLGLAGAKGFAVQSGGDLLIESTQGIGTEVWIVLPIAGAAS